MIPQGLGLALPDGDARPLELQPGMILLRAAVAPERLRASLEAVIEAAPPRHYLTPGGRRMAAAMTCCGTLGWMSDATGYRYVREDPDTGLPWPSLPSAFVDLAREAACRAGFEHFEPDACLVNRYAPGAGMTAHQDRDERQLRAPVVSVSLGLPATFFWHTGDSRRSATRSVQLLSGDVLVFGGPSRLVFHGVRPVRGGNDPVYGGCRWNLTLRRAG